MAKVNIWIQRTPCIQPTTISTSGGKFAAAQPEGFLAKKRPPEGG
jgi:hypothetical protein